MKVLISIHAYAGDEERVKAFMPWHEAHGHPVCILSPEDSPVTFLPSVRLGKRAYIGQDSLDRQYLHLKFLSEQPYDYFLMHDSDSLCLTPKIPDYVFQPDVFFSNEVCDPRPHETGLPKLAFQPSYALSKETLQRLVEVAPSVVPDPITPYIDNIMLRWVYAAGVKHQAFENSVFAHPVKTVEGIQRFRDALNFIP